jgi:orotate phosphoribosyltransferase
MAWKKRRGRLQSLAEGLVKAGALQFGTFTLADGKESPYFINLRALPSYPGLYRLIVDSMSEMISKVPAPEAFCTVPVSGLAIAAPIALAKGKPLLFTAERKHGVGKSLEGELRPGWKVVVIDDLATTGRTVLAAARAVEQEGGEVKHAAVILDRLEGARETLSKQGITLHSLTDVLELSDSLFAMGLISEANLKSITRTVGRG